MVISNLEQLMYSGNMTLVLQSIKLVLFKYNTYCNTFRKINIYKFKKINLYYKLTGLIFIILFYVLLGKIFIM